MKIHDGKIGALVDYTTSDNLVIVVDEKVLERHIISLPTASIIPFIVDNATKTLASVERLYDLFLDNKVDRTSLVVAVGGGTLCDAVAFAASTYLRGVPFAFVPTTLLAHVDAGIGGKNGVNFRGYKNMIGTFSDPAFILCDYSLLMTLPEKEVRNGLVEAIKHGVIADEGYFSFLEEVHQRRDRETIEDIAVLSRNIKTSIVSQDPLDLGVRHILNYGHTIGHAIEALCSLSHGEAVSIGMVAAAKISEGLGYVSGAVVSRIENLLLSVGLPTKMPCRSNDIRHLLSKDKKRYGDRVHFIAIEALGVAKVVPMNVEELCYAIDHMC